jgi:DNA helicase-2/ATP-dependent DNA helicase PcrA
MEVILDGLNEAQKSAVTSPASVVQVLAPPGSGKTKTLTARVAHLVSHGRLKPWNIIVCTFTIKAAREMKERIRGMLGGGIESKLILGTFHSVARRFLVRYGQEIGIDKNFGIADSADSLAIIKRIVKRGDYTADPKAVRSRISGLKAKGISADQFSSTSKRADQHEFACIYNEYEETLKASNLLDYDDLLLRCGDLLRKHPACVSTIEAVLIDEYQDTNNVQYELMTLLAQKMRRITIVGDPDQSIYSFRSAEIKNLYRMKEDYPDSLVINLENNYRSSGCILTAAMAVIEQDESRPNKPLQATHCVGEQPTLRHLKDVQQEAEWIVEEITRSRTLTAGLLSFNDYAILLRSASLSMSIERELGRAGIPYRMVGGKRFFDRVEIKVVLDYLRVVNQPNHNDALVRVLNVPSRKIGEVTLKALLEEAESKKLSLWSLLLNCAQGRSRPTTKISTQAQRGIDSFVNLILTSRRKLLEEEGEDCNLFDLITHILQKISFRTFLKAQYKDSWEDRWANVEELVAQATQMASNTIDGEEVPDDALPVVEGVEQREDTAADILSKFLANVALSTEVERPDGEEPNQVTISTIHAAKGLEWPIVFIPALYDGSIPHSRSEEHDEERRLLYVGMTRAQALLYLSCPVKQSQGETTLSPFISSQEVQRLLTLQGPSIGCSTITDLAQILRRPCPSNSDVQAARNLLERIEDDKYVTNRELIDTEESTRTFSNDKGEPPSKRLKMDSSRGLDGATAHVTMQSTSSFSIATTTLPSGNTGFTTARTHHKIIQEAKAVGALIGAPNFSAGRAAYKSVQKTEVKESKTASSKPVKPRPAGQGAITSFFARPTPKTAPEPEVALPKIRSLGRSQSSSSSNGPLSDISNTVQPQPTRPYQAPSISDRRPLNAPMVTKPRRAEPEADDEPTRYVLLSSSPARLGADPDPPAEYSDNEDEEEVQSSPSKSASVATSISSTGFRAATTFHTTSVSQVQSRSGASRALGVRRSAQTGWTSKPYQPVRPRQ